MSQHAVGVIDEPTALTVWRALLGARPSFPSLSLSASLAEQPFAQAA